MVWNRVDGHFTLYWNVKYIGTLFIYLYSQRGKEHLAETKETISEVMHMGCFAENKTKN